MPALPAPFDDATVCELGANAIAGPVVVYADDAIVVIHKPAGLLAVPGRTQADCASLRIARQFADALVVHRLDQATSGLMLLARGATARRRLGIAFEQRRVLKQYEAIVQGVLLEDSGCVDAPLAADWPNRPRQRVDALHGKPALTGWRVLDRDIEAQRTRVALAPETGRSHQLRVHMAALGHPIVGDRLYNASATDVEVERLLLHATRLEFGHPVHGATMAFHCPAPF